MKLRQQPENRGHEIVGSVIYGPVGSRRYGRSLGINLLPAESKVCTFNCVYCQLGWTEKKGVSGDFIPADTILLEIEKTLPEYLPFGDHDKKIDNIVLSGNGEPTLHPDFVKIANGLLKLVRAHRGPVPVICLTNGTTLINPEIYQILSLFDECCVKLDAAVNKVGLPQGDFDLSKILCLMAGLKNLVIQSCFFDGAVANTSAAQVDEWLGWMKGLSPRRIDLYTISRSTPHGGLKATSPDFLNGVEKRLSERGYFSVRVV